MKTTLVCILSAFFFLDSIVVAQVPPREPGYKILSQKFSTSVDKSGRAVETRLEKMLVTSNEGATSLSNFPVTVMRSETKFKLLKAEVKTAGKVFQVPARDVQKSIIPKERTGLVEIVQHIVPFDQVKVGSEITVEYQLETESLVKGQFNTILSVTNEGFADDESQSVLSDLPLKTVANDFDGFYELNERQLNGKYWVELKPTQKARMLVGREKKVGVVYVASTSTWLDFNKVIAGPYQQAIAEKLPPEFQAIVDSAKAGKTAPAQIEDAAEKIRALITYAGDWRTVKKSMFPVGHKTIVSRGRGDCKDYSVTMTAILRKLGFEAYVALTYRRDGTEDLSLLKKMADLPSSMAFNHAIVWTKDSTGAVRWIDPTNPKVFADILSDDLLGNFALVLDGKSAEVQYLPSKNTMPSLSRIEQTVTIAPDNSANVTAKLSMNPNAYNSFALIEAQVGAENMKRVFGALVNPRSKSAAEYKFEKNGDSFEYNFSLISSDWVSEKKFDSFYVYVNPIAIMPFGRMSDRGDTFLGHEGVTSVKTTLKEKLALDPIAHECHGRSPWMDFDRTVDIVGKDTVVYDSYSVKQSFIPRKDQKALAFTSFMADLRDCAADAYIQTFKDPRSISAKDLEQDNKKGPPVEKMTEADAKKMEDATDPSLMGYFARKLYKYYTLRLAKDELAHKDPMARWGRAVKIRQMGYSHGTNFGSGYLDDALREVSAGIAYATGDAEKRLYALRSKIHADLGNKTKADEDFKFLLAKYPTAFETYFQGYYLNEKSDNFANAEKWLHSAAIAATDPADKFYVRKKLASLLGNLKRYPEAVAQYNELLKSSDASAWDYHNAAIVHYAMNDYDVCIDYEKKALAMMEFGAAKDTLSDALTKKGARHSMTARDPATQQMTNTSEPLYLEALKWNPENVDALAHLSMVHLNYFTLDQKAEQLKKGKKYLDRALELNPRHPMVQLVLQGYLSMSKQHNITL